MPKNASIPSHRQFNALIRRLTFCPSCSTWRLPQSATVSPTSLRKRNASTLVSSTAINARKPIPARYKQLHEALTDLKKRASAQANLSRLQLAIQGLESESPPTRVAVLGLNVQTTARRLVRLLLADALNAEERWEKQLTKEDGNYPQGLLIRYGVPPNESLPQSRTAIPVLQIPASVLQRNNIEILVSSVSGPQSSDGPRNWPAITSDALLSPTIGTPTNGSGRSTTINQPVHKSLLVAKSLDELMAIAGLLASTNFNSPDDREMVDVVVNLANAPLSSIDKTLVVDAMKAEEGLSAIRTSLNKATTYEHNWIESGMPSLSKWLTLASATQQSATLPLPIKNLISSLIASASSNIRAESVQALQSAMLQSMSPATRTSLENAITDFSRQSHQELQSGLASAWSSRNWRKLAWYKLFWRVDDVSLIITDLISNTWLPRTERAVYELSGRLVQAGIPPIGFEIESPGVQPEPEYVETDVAKPLVVLQSQLATTEQVPMQPVLVNHGGNVGVELVSPPRPTPLAATISATRQIYMANAIADLTTTAQQLVLRTLSITGLTAGLSGLAYFSLAAGSLYEAGTIVALGTAYALWRMQTDWQRSCRALEQGLMQTGRDVLRKIEERMQALVQSGGRVAESEVEVRGRKDAEAAVQEVQEALKKLG